MARLRFEVRSLALALGLVAGCGPAAAPGAADAGVDGGRSDSGLEGSGDAGASASGDAGALVDGSSADAFIDGRPPLASGLFEVGSLELDADPAELAPLGAIAGDSEVVAFGETIHFSYGYARARARLIRYAIEHLGFRVVALEGHWALAHLSDAYVQGEASLEEGIAGLCYDVWMNRPTVDLLQWIRAFNEVHSDDRVSIIGMDIQASALDGLHLRALADELVAEGIFDASVPSILHDELRSCPGAWQDSTAAGYADPVDGPIITTTATYFDARFEACNEALDAITTMFDGVALDTRRRTFATIAINAIRAFQAEIFYYYSDPRQSYDVRDAAMAETFLAQRALLAPGTRIALFAHNAHISRNSTDDSAGWGFESTGTHLGRALGDDYAPVGLFASNVYWNWPDEEIGHGESHVTSRNSIESILDAYGREYLLVDLEAATTADGAFEPGRYYEMAHDEVTSFVPPLTLFRGLFFLHASEETPDRGGL